MMALKEPFWRVVVQLACLLHIGFTSCASDDKTIAKEQLKVSNGKFCLFACSELMSSSTIAQIAPSAIFIDAGKLRDTKILLVSNSQIEENRRVNVWGGLYEIDLQDFNSVVNSGFAQEHYQITFVSRVYVDLLGNRQIKCITVDLSIQLARFSASSASSLQSSSTFSEDQSKYIGELENIDVPRDYVQKLSTESKPQFNQMNNYAILNQPESIREAQTSINSSIKIDSLKEQLKESLDENHSLSPGEQQPGGLPEQYKLSPVSYILLNGKYSDIQPSSSNEYQYPRFGLQKPSSDSLESSKPPNSTQEDSKVDHVEHRSTNNEYTDILSSTSFNQQTGSARKHPMFGPYIPGFETLDSDKSGSLYEASKLGTVKYRLLNGEYADTQSSSSNDSQYSDIVKYTMERPMLGPSEKYSSDSKSRESDERKPRSSQGEWKLGPVLYRFPNSENADNQPLSLNDYQAGGREKNRFSLSDDDQLMEKSNGSDNYMNNEMILNNGNNPMNGSLHDQSDNRMGPGLNEYLGNDYRSNTMYKQNYSTIKKITNEVDDSSHDIRVTNFNTENQNDIPSPKDKDCFRNTGDNSNKNDSKQQKPANSLQFSNNRSVNAKHSSMSQSSDNRMYEHKYESNGSTIQDGDGREHRHIDGEQYGMAKGSYEEFNLQYEGGKHRSIGNAEGHLHMDYEQETPKQPCDKDQMIPGFSLAYRDPQFSHLIDQEYKPSFTDS